MTGAMIGAAWGVAFAAFAVTVFVLVDLLTRGRAGAAMVLLVGMCVVGGAVLGSLK